MKPFVSGGGRTKISFVSEPIGPSTRLGTVSEGEFNAARDLVVGVCANHGTVGPCGQSTVSPHEAAVIEDPDFYVVDDQLYEEVRVIVVEPNLEAMSPEWLEELARTMFGAPGWDVLLRPGENIQIWVSPGLIRVSGWKYETTDAAGLIQKLRSDARTRLVAEARAFVARTGEVRELLPDVWRMSAGESLVFIAAFRTRSDGTRGDSVWILHRNDSSRFDLDDYFFEPDAQRLTLHWASPSGEMTPYAARSVPEGPEETILAEWILVENGMPVVGSARLRMSKNDQHWSFSLVSH